MGSKPPVHSQFTCEELEALLTNVAEVWIGIIDLDDINDAEMPEMVALWERAARLWQERLTEQDHDRSTFADIPGATRTPR